MFRKAAGGMAKAVLTAAMFWVLPVQAQADGIMPDCTYKGIPLYGNVKIVDHFPDIKVQAVSRFADLRVKTVDGYPNACGRWKIVDAFPDFTVQFVEHFPDITIQIVEIYPGLSK